MATMDITYKSVFLKRYVNFKVILPVEDTKLNGTKKKPEIFKTLYLLHGFGGNSAEWMNSSRISKIARDNNLAVVMPDGENSFYVDNEETAQYYGSFVGKELVEITRKMFPLSKKKEDTFIGGVSMGGFGSLLIGSRFSDTFGAIICLSSGFVLNDLSKGGAPYLEEAGMRVEELKHLTNMFGDLSLVIGSNNDPIVHVKNALAKNFLSPIYLICGTEDYVYPNNVQMKNDLITLGADVTWEVGPGTHEWTFWDPAIEKAIHWCLGL